MYHTTNKALPLYEKWMGAGRLPDMGLCNSLPPDLSDLMDEFITPEEGDLEPHESIVYWAYGAPVNRLVRSVDYDEAGKFTALRQNVVLLLAAMNNEL